MRRLLAVVGGGLVLAVLPAAPAAAHPLGNFTVNHYDGLTLLPSSVDDEAVLDSAEIPTAQARSSVDANGDGQLLEVERASYAVARCTDLARSLVLAIGQTRGTFHVRSSSYELRPGAAGLQTSRLLCGLTADADLSTAALVSFRDSYLGDRIGWREITAAARGVHLRESPVPARSVSDELRHYPNDLLSSPLDVRAAAIDVQPGVGLSTLAQGIRHVPGAGGVARIVESLNRVFTRLAGSRHLTVGVGLLAVAVSLLLGATHAALPGHGKTVMAAYIAGTRGRSRDAVIVGATVTATHTAGVLGLGLALTLSSSLAGDRVTTELGVVSGLLIATIGAGLAVTAIRRRRGNEDGDGHGRQHGHEHAHDHGHGHSHATRPSGRAGLVGMGVAGGLVPSPSALVVLLGAVALGRTVFGVLLVLTYGVGMAATLTAAGLLLVRVTGRFRDRAAGPAAWARRVGGSMPLVTAGLVLFVGLALAARSAVAV
jgi:ABC-type nickel/cobalt efflux system permease component RcnA